MVSVFFTNAEDCGVDSWSLKGKDTNPIFINVPETHGINTPVGSLMIWRGDVSNHELLCQIMTKLAPLIGL